MRNELLKLVRSIFLDPGNIFNEWLWGEGYIGVVGFNLHSNEYSNALSICLLYKP